MKRRKRLTHAAQVRRRRAERKEFHRLREKQVAVAKILADFSTKGEEK